MAVALVPVFVLPGVPGLASAASVPPPPKPFPGWIASSQREGYVAPRFPEAEPGQPVRQVAEAFKKTRVCRFYPRCNKGDSCRFAHAPEEIRNRPNFTKTRMCAGYFDGRCKLSNDECSFAHGQQELRTREVPYFGMWTGSAPRSVCGDVDMAGAASCGDTTLGDRTPTTAASRSGSFCTDYGKMSARSIRLAQLTSAQSVGSSSAETTPRAEAVEDCDDVEGPGCKLLDAAAVAESPEVKAIMSEWTARIRAMSGSTMGAAKGATHDECLAALMKAMPDYYED